MKRALQAKSIYDSVLFRTILFLAAVTDEERYYFLINAMPNWLQILITVRSNDPVIDSNIRVFAPHYRH